MTDDIQTIKNSIRIYDLANMYHAEPQKEDGNGAVKCKHNPLREEKTSSLFIHPSTNSWIDHGTEIGGSIIDFLMEADKISTGEAIRKIKDMAGIENKPYIQTVEHKKSYMAPEVVIKIWNQQLKADFSKHSDEMYNIAPKWLFDNAKDEDLKSFFDIVKIDKHTQTSFILLKDIEGEARCLRYRRFNLVDHESGEVNNIKWMALAGTQSSFPYVRIKNDEDITLIVEGTHDYLTAILAGYNVIALPSAGFKLSNDVLKNRVCVFLDDDDGKEFMKSLYENADCSKIYFNHAEFKAKHGIKEAKDFSDYLEKFSDIDSFKKAIEDQCDIISNLTTTAQKNRLLNFNDAIDDIKATPWMIREIMPSNCLFEMIGGSGTYKSFLMLDMMFCVSNGLQYHGLDVNQGITVYVAGEGSHGAKTRVRGLSQHYGVRPSNFYMLPFPSNLMDKNEMDLLASDIKSIADGNKIAMIVFDTLHRNSAGSDENSATDFAKILGFIDKYARPFSEVVGYVHHTGSGLDAKGRGRGTTSRFGAVDTSMLVESEEELTTVMSCMKQKDSEKFHPIGFKFDKKNIGIFDTYDEEMTTLIPIMDRSIKLSEKSTSTSKTKNDDSNIVEDVSAFIKENDGCVQDSIKNHFKGVYSNSKIFNTLKDNAKGLWRSAKGEKNSWTYHAVISSPQPQEIIYEMPSMELF